jgi:hypothetical protein
MLSKKVFLAGELNFSAPPPKEYRFACILTGMAKADVPIGTEVWIKD